MPIAPKNPFFKFTCAVCGWSIVTYQTSDAIHRPSACPKCRETQLDLSVASTTESIKAYPMEFLKRFL